jgi:RNA polymerase sigma-70 factor (ECF subfamily)
VDSTPASLLRRLQQPHDPVAWGRFVDLYSGLLLRWARGLHLQDADAADLVQDVFTTLVRVLPTFDYDQHKSFRGWLRTVLRNRYRDWARRRGLEPRQADAAVLTELADRDGGAVFEEEEYRRHLVGRALELLRDEFRPTTWQAFWEHGVRGRPAGEVAAELGLTPGAVYAARFRVLARVREHLQEMLD